MKPGEEASLAILAFAQGVIAGALLMWPFVSR